jgi:hypothetical protein
MPRGSRRANVIACLRADIQARGTDREGCPFKVTFLSVFDSQPQQAIAWEEETFDIPVPEGNGKCTLCILVYTQDRILQDQASSEPAACHAGL